MGAVEEEPTWNQRQHFLAIIFQKSLRPLGNNELQMTDGPKEKSVVQETFDHAIVEIAALLAKGFHPRPETIHPCQFIHVRLPLLRSQYYKIGDQSQG